MTDIQKLIARWDSNDGKPYKGSLIDWSAYEAAPDSLGCMCAQGQVLHTVGGWTPDKLRNTAQETADIETAKLLNISSAHAILLRQVNDRVDGAPSIVLTDPEKVLAGEWSKLLDFWWHIHTLGNAGWQKVAAAGVAAGDAARAAAWAAAGDAARAAAWAAARAAARDAAWAAAWAAARDAAGVAAGVAAWETQGAHIFRAAGRPFFFLPMFGFASPDDIPARPADYGVTL